MLTRLPSPAALRACRSRRERGRVTVLRNISGKFSGSRNTGSDLTEYDPDTCLFCRKRFDRGQMRYPIRNWEAWEPDFGSVCMPCFKDIDDPDYTSKQERYERDCNGCGEPILTPTEGVFRWQVCSKRCYQRALRNRNRMFESAICKGCKRHFKPTRKDARFCSNACRQWAYRARKR